VAGSGMAHRQSAGLLVYRNGVRGLEVFLVHPGGPFWQRKDAGAWSIPKGEFDEPESALNAARREFTEETGLALDGEFVALKPVRQRSGKVVQAFAIKADFDPGAIRSNTFSLEWPPRSGKMSEFPEIDRADWFDIAQANIKLIEGQRPLLVELETRLSAKR
jgi:predicted NUDIX family NTP pyrophosphohydrolase